MTHHFFHFRFRHFYSADIYLLFDSNMPGGFIEVTDILR